jgi:hypothetical protein
MHLTTTGIQPVGTIGDGRLDLDALNRMQWLGMVINKSMRLLAPAPAAFRKALADKSIQGYFTRGRLEVRW